ncbi:MAG: precorrin-6A reductase [Coriobacteriia bacterium]|nr:precorrin-6A reductase [Coriobacteriia bacterium]
MRVLVFGGTTEGRLLSLALVSAGMEVTLSVATEYGREVFLDAAEAVESNSAANTPTDNTSGLHILSGRLEGPGLASLLADGFDHVVDATHPYAASITASLREACAACSLSYLRLLRPSAPDADQAGDTVSFVADTDAAVRLLAAGTGPALLTIGSKELAAYTQVPGYQDRFYPRILPMPDSLERALQLGFRAAHIICMQGPFDLAMNQATLAMAGARYLVTKDTGDAGGFTAKLEAARSMGVQVIVIGRPVQESGYSLPEILSLLGIAAPAAPAAPEIQAAPTAEPAPEPLPPAGYFPLFVPMQGCQVLVVGAGAVATRRIQTLLGFGADITVIAPQADGAIERLEAEGRLRLLRRNYQAGDVAALPVGLVIAATDQRPINYRVGQEARAAGILVSVADRREECSCYFPAIVESPRFLAGLISKDADHAALRRLAEELRQVIAE